MATAERTYVDPSALRSLYVHDTRSRAFCRWRSRLRGSLPLTAHGRTEVVNGICLAAFRGDLAASAAEAALADLSSDLDEGRFFLVDLPWRKTFGTAAELSAAHTPRLGTRTLDVLHVAAALVLASRAFVTYDDRQAALAKAVGLRVSRP